MVASRRGWGHDPQLPWIQGPALTPAIQGSWSGSLFSFPSEDEEIRLHPVLWDVASSPKKQKQNPQKNQLVIQAPELIFNQAVKPGGF